jgi:hypothetical protein
LQLQETLEAPLLGPQGEQWRKKPRALPEESSLWIGAQSLSEDASKQLGSNLSIIFPLEKTKERGVVDAMWTRINDVRSCQHLWMIALMHTTDVQSCRQDGLGYAVANGG